MSLLTVNDNIIAAVKSSYIDVYYNSSHTVIDIQENTKNSDDKVCDIIVSTDNKYFAFITSHSKQLVIHKLPQLEKLKSFTVPRSASKIRFSANNSKIFVADKTGDVLSYDINGEDNGTKLLGHLSLLLNVLQSNDGKFIITSDRDEKIRVSCYPNTYNIQTYCLGHKEFVNHIEFLTHNNMYLTSTSGDGTIKFWNYVEGTLSYSIDTHCDVKDDKIRETFTKIMDEEGVEVNSLPITLCTLSQLNESESLLAVGMHLLKKLLVYSIQTYNKQFQHKLIQELTLGYCPAAIQFFKKSLFVYDGENCNITEYAVLCEENNVSLNIIKNIKLFENQPIKSITDNTFENVKVLFKRRYDNVQEYQERKKQRLLEKTK